MADSPDAQNTTNLILSSVDIAYILLVNFTSFLSMVGALIVIGCFCMYPEIRTTSRKLLSFLSGANCILCLGSILQATTYFKSTDLLNEKSSLCQSAASFAVFGNVSSFLWTDSVTFYLFMCVSLRMITVGNKITWLFHILSWGMPVIVTLTAGSADVYGYDDTLMLKRHRPSACWISDRVTNQKDWYFITQEGWAIASFFFAGIISVVMACSIKFRVNNRRVDRDYVIEDMAIQTANKQLILIPTTYIVLRMWGTLHFIVSEYGSAGVKDANSDWLLLVRGIGDNAQGFANCIIFCSTTKGIRRKIGKCLGTTCGRWITWCKKKSPIPETWRPSRIVREIKFKKKKGLDISGISLDFPNEEANIMEDDVIFERD